MQPTRQKPRAADAWPFAAASAAPNGGAWAVSMAQMRSRQRKTLRAIFENPVRANISWAVIESLLCACGAGISEGRGSRVRIALHGVSAVFHRPHPQKETDKGAVVSMRCLLLEAGVEP
jgi:HicA toxin of bacterial toxin-antitoxin,